jgi:hypothetical protein
VTVAHYVSVVVQTQQEFVGVQLLLTAVCVQKAAKAAFLIAQPVLLQCNAGCIPVVIIHANTVVAVKVTKITATAVWYVITVTVCGSDAHMAVM